MKETGVVIGNLHKPLYWHTPEGRTAGSIEDSRHLWDILWNNRERIIGFAHTHPGSGLPLPSATDLSTFAAIEAGLGRYLTWWIASSDRMIETEWDLEAEEYVNYAHPEDGGMPLWLEELRIRSEY